MKLRDPKATALIFESGKMVVTGANSEMAIRLAAKKFTRVLQMLGYPAQFEEFKIQNMVAGYNVGFPIDIEGLSVKHRRFCEY